MPEKLRIVAIEEHVAPQVLLDAWAHTDLPQTAQFGFGDTLPAVRMRDHGELRLAEMDEQGIDVAVLSLAAPGIQNLAAADALSVARDVNDTLAEIVAAHPDRFQAFAAIPTPAPGDAAAELERAINQLGLKGAMLYGRTGDIYPDAAEYDALYAAAVALNAPLQFHPQTPTPAVYDAYYSGLGNVGVMLGGAGLGWHYDLGVQFMRMIFAGVFDRHPDLQVITGHWGQLVLFYFDSSEFLGPMAGLQRAPGEYFRENFWVHGSGRISERYLRWTAELMGTDRMLYSTDYPNTFNSEPGPRPFFDTGHGVARAFLEQAPLTDDEKAAIGHLNWERLTKDLGEARL